MSSAIKKLFIIYSLLALAGLVVGLLFGGRAQSYWVKVKRSVVPKQQSQQAVELIDDLYDLKRRKGDAEALRFANQKLSEVPPPLQDEILCFIAELESSGKKKLSPKYQRIVKEFANSNMEPEALQEQLIAETDAAQFKRRLDEFVNKYPNNSSLTPAIFDCLNSHVLLKNDKFSVDILYKVIKPDMPKSQHALALLCLSERQFRQGQSNAAAENLERCASIKSQADFWNQEWEQRFDALRSKMEKKP